MTVEISVIIVNYRSWNVLRNCLASLAEISQRHLEIIVVDNHSDDGKLKRFSEEFKQVKFIENTGNNGYAHGCNLGAERASGAYLLFLNPDTVVTELALSNMLNAAKERSDLGIISCLQKRDDGSLENNNKVFLQLSTMFGLYRAVAKTFRGKADNITLNNGEKAMSRDWVSGSIVFISREWFKRVGGWNEDYWMYFEDMDLCKRVENSGGKVVILDNTFISHLHGGASRINEKTSVQTRTEVLISKHVYIENNFAEGCRWPAHSLLFAVNFIEKLIVAIVGVPLYFVPKMRVRVKLFFSVLAYYGHVITSGIWLSVKSVNYPH